MARRKQISKTRISSYDSLDRLVENSDYNMPYVDSFEDSLIESIDIQNLQNLNLTNEEKAILSMKNYMSEREVSKVYNIPQGHFKKIKKKLREEDE